MGTQVESVMRDNRWTEEPIRVKQFFGGEGKGRCVQLTARSERDGHQYIQLTRGEAKRLAHRLIEWADGHANMGDDFDE